MLSYCLSSPVQYIEYDLEYLGRKCTQIKNGLKRHSLPPTHTQWQCDSDGRSGNGSGWSGSAAGVAVGCTSGEHTNNARASIVHDQKAQWTLKMLNPDAGVETERSTIKKLSGH